MEKAKMENEKWKCEIVSFQNSKFPNPKKHKNQQFPKVQ